MGSDLSREALFVALDEELRFQMGGAPGTWIEALTHIFAALEARGLDLVPKVATDAMRRAGREIMDAEGFLEKRCGHVWTAMVTASKDPSHD